jgi:hypothetical protein
MNETDESVKLYRQQLGLEKEGYEKSIQAMVPNAKLCFSKNTLEKDKQFPNLGVFGTLFRHAQRKFQDEQRRLSQRGTKRLEWRISAPDDGKEGNGWGVLHPETDPKDKDLILRTELYRSSLREFLHDQATPELKTFIINRAKGAERIANGKPDHFDGIGYDWDW